MKDMRYQNQPWYVKFWRRRHYFRIPFVTFRMWIRSGEKFRFCWALAKGCIQSDMKWYYTTEEVFGKLKKLIN